MPMPRTTPSNRPTFWRDLIARHVVSRLSVEEFCQQAGVSTASFYAWRKRLKSSRDEASTPTVRPRAARPSLVPLHIVVGGGQITIELAEPMRVLVPLGCDEESLRVAIAAALRAGEGRHSC